MKKYHVATGDGKGYYGVGYESYRQAESLLKISQEHDPQAHIVDEDYHFTNADRIRDMSDDELAKMFMGFAEDLLKVYGLSAEVKTTEYVLDWLKQPAEVLENG